MSISVSATSPQKKRALKDFDRVDKMLYELSDYENDIFYPLATQQVALDLDDGVKVNHKKLGKSYETQFECDDEVIVT